MTAERLTELALPLLPPLDERETEYLHAYARFLIEPGGHRRPPLPRLGDDERAKAAGPAIRRTLRGLLLIDAE